MFIKSCQIGVRSASLQLKLYIFYVYKVYIVIDIFATCDLCNTVLYCLTDKRASLEAGDELKLGGAFIYECEFA